jgi:hypothetical protein
MKRKALLLFAAAAAVVAIVVLATGAFAGTAGRSDQSGNGAFVSCLASHGVQVPSDDPTALKQWLADHQSDPAVQAALQACAPQDDTDTGPTPAALVTCLEQHGVDVPNDVKENPDRLKSWLAGAMHQASVKAAVDDCTGSSRSDGPKK